MDLTDKTELLGYLKSNGLWAKHGLGQNFLVDKGALDKIVGVAELKPHLASPSKGEGREGDLVIEVGPGLGTLTEELIQQAGKVIAVELDEKLARLLAERYDTVISSETEKSFDSQLLAQDDVSLKDKKISPPPMGSRDDKVDCVSSRDDNLVVVNEDILKINLKELVGDKPYKVVANIPYYITSKIIQLFLTAENKPETIVVLTQKEVAERICAKPGDMSTLSISVQVYGTPEIIGVVPKESFFPSPKVDSAILRISDIYSFNSSTKHEIRNTKQIKNLKNDDSKKISPPPKGSRNDKGVMGSRMTGPRDDSVGGRSEKDFFRAVHIGFASKRKTLANNLASGYHIDKKMALDIIKSIGLNENVRAQELSVGNWKDLALKVKC